MTTSVSTGTDYEVPITTDEDHQEEHHVENKEKLEENNQQKQGDVEQIIHTSPIHNDENLQEEDILVEENVTPFYMNSGILNLIIEEKYICILFSKVKIFSKHFVV